MPVVLIEKQTPQITVLTLNRPERRNALTIELLTELTAAIKVVSDDANARILIFRGAGAAFCTGLDLKAATLQNAQSTAAMVLECRPVVPGRGVRRRARPARPGRGVRRRWRWRW